MTIRCPRRCVAGALAGMGAVVWAPCALGAALVSQTRSIETYARIFDGVETVEFPRFVSNVQTGPYANSIESFVSLGAYQAYGEGVIDSLVSPNLIELEAFVNASGEADPEGDARAEADIILNVAFSLTQIEYWSVDAIANRDGLTSAVRVRLFRGASVVRELSASGGASSLFETLTLSPGDYHLEATLHADALTPLGGGAQDAGATLSLAFERVPPCPGDANGDRRVDFEDLNTVLTRYGQTGAPGALPGDVDADGDVDFRDLNIVLTAYGATC